MAQATPSKVQPSPTVHTKEALGTVFCLCVWHLNELAKTLLQPLTGIFFFLRFHHEYVSGSYSS
jgi:hypothetical protein